MDDVLVLEQNPSFTTKARLFLDLVFPSIMIGLSRSSSNLMFTFGFWIADKTGDHKEISAFGLAVFIMLVSAGNLGQPLIEKVANEASLAFSTKDRDTMKASLMRGAICFVGYISAVFLPLALFCDTLLLKSNTEPAIARRAKQIFQWLVPLEVIRLSSEALTAYMASQGVQTGFGTITVVTMLLGAPASYYFGYSQRQGIGGWYFGRGILEVTRLMGILLLYYFRVEDGWIGMRHVKLGFSRLKEFFCDVMLFTAGYYAESFGYQLSTIFVIFIGDPLQISAYTMLTNLKILFVCIPFGFNTLIRARINYLIGLGKSEVAKVFFKVSMVGLMVVSLSFSCCIYLSRKYIVQLMAGNNPKIGVYFEELLVWFAVFFFLLMYFVSIFSISRATGRAIFNLVLDVIFLLGVQITSGVLLLRIRKPNCVLIFLNLLMCLMMVEVIIATVLLKADWRHLNQPHAKSLPLIENQQDPQRYSLPKQP